MSAVPVRQRVVAVEADFDERAVPRWRYGSGFLVGGGRLLTAAHVVRDAAVVHVYGPDRAHWIATLEGALIGANDSVDLALLDLPGAPRLPAVPVGVVDRHGSAGDVWVERCWAVGFPAFYDVRRDETAAAVRAAAQVRGAIPPLSGEGEHLLSFHVTAAPRPLPDGALDQSEWSGMSGAGVCAVVDERGSEHNLLIGVVVEHARQRGSSDITVLPLDRLADDDGVHAASEWGRRLGVTDWAALPRLPAVRERPEPPYHAVVRDIRGHTDVLVGREEELSRIGAFATGDDGAFGPGSVNQGYLWLVGEAWAGKTALVAEAVHALPPEVDTVAFFLVARESQASREQFLGAVLPQLAWLLDEDPPSVVDLQRFRDLWERAAQQAEARDRHLLLVVDGLDEDLRAGGYSVAALLPTRQLGPHARVLVTSRPHLALPDDVHARHPLRSTKRVALAGHSPGDVLKSLAEQEIEALLTIDWAQPAATSLALDVLGLLTAARGALSIDDLAGMTAVHPHIVHAFVTERAARSLRPEGRGNERRYGFAHQTLYEYCRRRDHVGGDARYRRRLHDLADTWRERGWPAGDEATPGTPRYLLDTYPAMLAAHADVPVPSPDEPQRLAALVSDIGWVDAAVLCVGVDQVLATLRTAGRLVPADAGVATMLRLLELRAHRLRPAHDVVRPGSTATHLAWEALRNDLAPVARAAGDWLRRCPPPQFVPVWTSERTSPHLVRLLGYHAGEVSALAATPDGRVVSCGADGVLRLWDPAVAGGPGVELGRHDGGIAAVVVAGDDQVVTGGADGAVRLWDLAQPGAQSFELGRHEQEVTAVVVTADGRVVSGAADGTVRLWDPAVAYDSGIALGRHDGRVEGAAVTADGRVVSGAGDGARLWDPTAPGAAGIDLGGHERVTAVAVTPDGRVVTGGWDGTLRLLTPAVPDDSGTELGRHDRGYVRTVFAVAVAPDGRVVTGGWDGTVRLWDPAARGGSGATLGVHGGWVKAVAVLPDGRVASGGGDGAVRLWDAAARGQPGAARLGHGWVTALAILPGGQALSVGSDSVLWDLGRPDDPGRALAAPLPAVQALAVAPDGRVALGSSVGTVELWDPAAPGEPGTELGQHEGAVAAVAVLADGRVVTGGRDRTVRLWDPAVPDRPGFELGRHRGRVTAAAALPDGRVVSSGNEGTLRLWDPAAPGGSGVELGRHRGRVAALAVTADGRVVAGGWDGTVRLWDPAAPGQPGTELGRHRAEVSAVAATPDGALVSAGDDGALQLWDRAAPDGSRVELTLDHAVRALAVTPDGRLVTGATGGVTAFELTSAISPRSCDWPTTS